MESSMSYRAKGKACRPVISTAGLPASSALSLKKKNPTSTACLEDITGFVDFGRKTDLFAQRT